MLTSKWVLDFFIEELLFCQNSSFLLVNLTFIMQSTKKLDRAGSVSPALDTKNIKRDSNALLYWPVSLYSWAIVAG